MRSSDLRGIPAAFCAVSNNDTFNAGVNDGFVGFVAGPPGFLARDLRLRRPETYKQCFQGKPSMKTVCRNDYQLTNIVTDNLETPRI